MAALLASSGRSVAVEITVSPTGLQRFATCPEQWRLDHSDQRVDKATSAQVFGVVVHHSLHVLERFGDLTRALQTFDWYWHPQHTAELDVKPVEVWLPFQSYTVLRNKGLAMIENYADLRKDDHSQTLALEQEFRVPLGNDVYLRGVIDRLAVERRKIGNAYVEVLKVVDYKSGQRDTHLRWNMQGSCYARAVRERTFWEAFEEADELWERFKDSPRRFEWMDLGAMAPVDGGMRTEHDDRRVDRAAHMMARCIREEIFPLAVLGSNCKHCPYVDGLCGGLGQADPALDYDLIAQGAS